MDGWEYKALYKQFVKNYIKMFEKSGWDLDIDSITEPIGVCKTLLEHGAEFHYFDTYNRLLALFLHGVVVGLESAKETQDRPKTKNSK